jgi:hypothetical protein
VVSRWRPGLSPCGIYGEQNDNGTCFVLSTLGSPASSSSTKCSNSLIYHPGLVQRVIHGMGSKGVKAEGSQSRQ